MDPLKIEIESLAQLGREVDVESALALHLARRKDHTGCARHKAQVLPDNHGGEVAKSDWTEREERDHQAVAVVHGVEALVMRRPILPIRHEAQPEIQQRGRRLQTRELVAHRPRQRRETAQRQFDQRAVSAGIHDSNGAGQVPQAAEHGVRARPTPQVRDVITQVRLCELR